MAVGAVGRPVVLLVACGSVGGPWFLCVHSLSTAHDYLFCAYGRRCHRNRSARRRSRTRSTPGFRSSLLGGASCAKTHGSSKPLNGSQAAQRLSHSARRSVEDGPTAIWVCALARRRLPGLHAMPGVRGGETVWREEMRPAWMAGRPSPDLERCCKSAQYSFPCGVSAGTSPYPLILNGQTFR